MYENWFLKNRMVLLYFICGQEILQKNGYQFWVILDPVIRIQIWKPNLDPVFFKIRIWVFNSVDYV